MLNSIHFINKIITINRKTNIFKLKLELPSEFKIHPVFHVSLLKPCKTFDEFIRTPPPPPITIPETQQEEYEVEDILNKENKRMLGKKFTNNNYYFYTQ